LGPGKIWTLLTSPILLSPLPPERSPQNLHRVRGCRGRVLGFFCRRSTQPPKWLAGGSIRRRIVSPIFLCLFKVPSCASQQLSSIRPYPTLWRVQSKRPARRPAERPPAPRPQRPCSRQEQVPFSRPPDIREFMMPFGQRMPQAMPYHPFVRLRFFFGFGVVVVVSPGVHLCAPVSDPKPSGACPQAARQQEGTAGRTVGDQEAPPLPP